MDWVDARVAEWEKRGRPGYNWDDTPGNPPLDPGYRYLPVRHDHGPDCGCLQCLETYPDETAVP